MDSSIPKLITTGNRFTVRDVRWNLGDPNKFNPSITLEYDFNNQDKKARVSIIIHKSLIIRRLLIKKSDIQGLFAIIRYYPFGGNCE